MKTHFTSCLLALALLLLASAELLANGAIKGTVTDAETGARLSSVSLRMEGRAYGAYFATTCIGC